MDDCLREFAELSSLLLFLEKPVEKTGSLRQNFEAQQYL